MEESAESVEDADRVDKMVGEKSMKNEKTVENDDKPVHSFYIHSEEMEGH